MSFFKSLWTDLVEKRLWPILIVLLLALVAVPVFLGSGGQNGVDVATLGASGPTGTLGSEALVALDDPGATRRDREGKLRDPFKQRQVKAVGPTGPTGLTGTGGQPPPAGTTNQTSTNPPTSQAPPIDTTPKTTPKATPTPPKTTPAPPKPPDSLESYVAEIRFGRADGTRPRTTIPRLTALPTVEQPFFVYLGLLPDRKTAVFLLASVVQATGRGRCQPDNTRCLTLELRAGETERLAVTGDDGSVTQYSLTMLDARRDAAASTSGIVTTNTSGTATTRSTTQAKATGKTATKDTPAGGDLGTDRYTYDDETGLLHRVRSARSATLGAHLPGAAGGPAVDRAKLEAGRLAALPAEGLWSMPEYAPLL